jgi:hypothetical protein
MILVAFHSKGTTSPVFDESYSRSRPFANNSTYSISPYHFNGMDT